MKQALLNFNNPLLSVRANIAHSFFMRAKGLLGTNTPHPLLIYPGNQIHTIGMKYPIDVIYMDKNLQILSLKKNLSPGRIFSPVCGSYYILELPSGFIVQNSINLVTTVAIGAISE